MESLLGQRPQGGDQIGEKEQPGHKMVIGDIDMVEVCIRVNAQDLFPEPSKIGRPQ
jgi:hypothetical protein